MSEVTRRDILRHYFASLIVYGVVLLCIAACPLYAKSLDVSKLNHLTVLTGYYLLYVVFALPVFNKYRPASIKNSRNVTILNYVKRQFTKGSPIEKIKNMEPSEDEKQALWITFIKAFFGVYCLNLLCSKYIPSMDYDMAFIKEMFGQAFSYAHTQGIIAGFAQFIDDSADMLIKFTFIVTTIVFVVSYLTEANFLKNKIRYADVSPLGLFTCLVCYYPFTTILNKFLPLYSENLVPVDHDLSRVVLNLLLILSCFTSMIAIMCLGTKSGNLTNRGIVTKFPYNIVRHPDYGAQILSIILLYVPLYFTDAVTLLGKVLYTLGTMVWIYVYYLRALTEERNLLKDENYVHYMQKVKYRFIPKLF